MTQIQTEHQNQSTNAHHTRNRPADLDSIYQTLSKLIPSNNSQQSISIPSPLSLFALTCHAFLISNSFRLNASQSQSSSDQDPSLLTDWHSILASNQHSLLFSYSHLQSSLTFEFTFSKIGNRISIAAITVQDDRLSTWNLSIPEYVEPSHFPMNLTAEQAKDSNGFRSSTHLLNFISLFVNEILNRLLPDLFPMTSINQRSPPSSMTQSSSTSNSQVTQPIPSNPPDQRSYPPPSHLNNNPIRNPLEIGRSDLEPIGTSNLGIPSLYNHLPRPDLGQRSGMMVHPNHPIFHPPSSRLPQPESLHPPGARFDPIGPNSSAPPRPHPGFDLDPMGGLGQGLPLQNAHFGFRPNRPDFNEFRPPAGPGGSGYDDMFM